MSVRDSFQESRDIIFLQQYIPAQILMNSKNYNYTVREIIARNAQGNKNISTLGETLLQMEGLYERGYQLRGAKYYDNLTTEELAQYNKLKSKAKQDLLKAKNSLYDLLIREFRVEYDEVYYRLCNKIKNLEKKISKGSTFTDKCNMHNYLILKADYEFVTSKGWNRKLFDK